MYFGLAGETIEECVNVDLTDEFLAVKDEMLTSGPRDRRLGLFKEVTAYIVPGRNSPHFVSGM